MRRTLEWSNVRDVDLSKGLGYLYFANIIDPNSKIEYRYIGKSTGGESRLRAYVRNVKRIFNGLPRRTTPGQEPYRAVHLAMAKACENGWDYNFYPLENVPVESLNEREQMRIAELNCALNSGRSWLVEDYRALTIADVLRSAT